MQSLPSVSLDQKTIANAVHYLRQGELVAFPTETVYGLGADASNEKAIQKLYATKGRPGNHPVIVHLAEFEQIYDWCDELSDYAKVLAKSFWPGPLTLIVKKAKHVSNSVTGGQDTVGIRIPAHPIALALLKVFDGGLAAPSANKYGRVSSTCAEHVWQEFGNEISMIIDGGNCAVGIESTIVDVTGIAPKILRPGIISENDLLDKIRFMDTVGSSLFSQSTDNDKQIRVPGSDKSHYAPHTPVLLLDRTDIDKLLKENQEIAPHQQKAYALLVFHQPNENEVRTNNYIQASEDAKIYARDLYANLRKLDESGAINIIVERPNTAAEWLAIVDRLKRAAAK